MSASSTARVLLVGKRARVLADLGRELRHTGLHVREETDPEQAAVSVDGAAVDVVVLGRAFTGARRGRLIERLRDANPRLKVVDGMAPVTAVLVAQVHEALTAPSRDARVVADAAFEPASNRVVLMLRRPARIGVTLHRLDPIYRAHVTPVFSGPLDRGRQHLPLARRAGRGERFLVVEADGEVTVHAVA
jgi:hypothetical protein